MHAVFTHPTSIIPGDAKMCINTQCNEKIAPRDKFEVEHIMMMHAIHLIYLVNLVIVKCKPLGLDPTKQFNKRLSQQLSSYCPVNGAEKGVLFNSFQAIVPLMGQETGVLFSMGVYLPQKSVLLPPIESQYKPFQKHVSSY
jgi:hypothetical protein